MDTTIKIVIGIIIGAVGFWILQTQKEGEQLNQHAVTEAATESRSQTKRAEAEQIIEKSTASEVEELNQLRTELYQARAELERYRSQPKSSLLGDPGRVSADNEDQSDQDRTEAKDHLKDIPEEFHQLVDPPERTKSFSELHKDFTSEEPDLSWALATEQQITSFMQNHQNSGYLLYFNIKCKMTMCEMMVKVRNEDTQKWNQLANDMVRQAWWDFRGDSSTGMTIENG